MPRYIDADKFADMSRHYITESELTNYIKLYGYADVVPKSEVEELNRECESLGKTVNEASELIRKLKDKVEEAKAEVARKIFEEIENMISPMLGLEDDKEYVAILSKNFAELKKKYTEVEHEP